MSTVFKRSSHTLPQWLRIFCVALLCVCSQAKADFCTASLPDLAFGSVSPTAGSDYFASGTLTISCTFQALVGNLLVVPNMSVCVSLGPGIGAASRSSRVLVNGVNQIGFNVYRDSSYSAASLWGDVSTSSSINAFFGALLALGTYTQTFSVYAKIPAASLVGAQIVANSDTVYTADFTGAGTVAYASGTLLAFPCTSGSTSVFSFKARATLVNNCAINVSPVAFNSTGVLAAPVRALGTVSVNCANGDAYRIALNGGTVAQAPAARKMKSTSTAETIAYNLSATLDGAIWGDGTGSTSTYDSTGNGGWQYITIYGMVPAQATPSPGVYRDTVTATIYF
jgi:spore coat protein U-like protein